MSQTPDFKNLSLSDFIRDPEIVFALYASGVFPMYDPVVDILHWIEPEERSVIFLDEFYISRSLQRFIRRSVEDELLNEDYGRIDRDKPFRIETNRDFEAVIVGCAGARASGCGTWINDDIKTAFMLQHEAGRAHSVELWQGDRLMGGLYGLHVGQVFCGESMFSRTSNASSVCLAHLVARMRRGGFSLLDIQFVNEHTAQFGAQIIPRQSYLEILKKGLTQPAQWARNPADNRENGHPPPGCQV